MYFLTNNTIIFEGHILTQIKEEWNGQIVYGGYIEKELVHNPNMWIDKNSYLINTQIHGKVIIGKNTIIRNSVIIGNCHIKDNCQITNCIICAPPDKGNHFESGIILNNQNIEGIGEYSKLICNDGNFINDHYNDVYLNITEHYCRVNCMTLTHEQADKILHSDELWEEFRQRNLDEPNIFTKDTKIWLQYWFDKIKK